MLFNGDFLQIDHKHGVVISFLPDSKRAPFLILAGNFFFFFSPLPVTSSSPSSVWDKYIHIIIKPKVLVVIQKKDPHPYPKFLHRFVISILMKIGSTNPWNCKKYLNRPKTKWEYAYSLRILAVFTWGNLMIQRWASRWIFLGFWRFSFFSFLVFEWREFIFTGWGYLGNTETGYL